MTAWWPRYSFPWIRGQKFQANEKHSTWVFVLKTVAHSAGCGTEVRETLSGVGSLPKEAASVCTEYITPQRWQDVNLLWSPLKSVRAWPTQRSLQGRKRMQNLSQGIAGKHYPAQTCWMSGGVICTALCRKCASWGSDKKQSYTVTRV